VMLVGAAARQTKPTTGGGLYFGIRAARMAAATAVQAIGQGDCSQQALAQYERAWHRLDGRELAHGAWLRRGFRRLPDKGFDTIIRLLNKPQAQRWISSLGDMDFPSRLLSPGAVTLVRKSTQVGSTESERLAGMGA
jgi:digeranylgeranylglycerophospholipid reductase